MITALTLIFVSFVSFALGVVVAEVRAKRIMDKETAAFLEEQGFVNTEPWAREQFERVIAYDCPEGHAFQGDLCNTSKNGVWVCLERIKYAEEMDSPLYDVELGVDEYLPIDLEAGTWIEVEIQNDCGHGCKIYEHNRTGRRALAHNSAYGCTRTFNPNKE